MNIESLNLDYYSNFLGEKEIRFYTNFKGNGFKKNIQKYSENHSCEIQLSQGENGIYFFSLWDGYFDSLMREILESEMEYLKLPDFIRNWNECKGWCDIGSNPEVISTQNFNWLIEKIKAVNEDLNYIVTKTVWDYDCFYNLNKFLSFVKSNDWELRICEE